MGRRVLPAEADPVVFGWTQTTGLIMSCQDIFLFNLDGRSLAPMGALTGVGIALGAAGGKLTSRNAGHSILGLPLMR